MSDTRDRRLMAHGLLLVTAALVIGLFISRMPSPRMGLATHLEALMLGMLLLLLGLVWPRFVLPERARGLLFWLPIVGAYCSVAMHQFAALYPSGEAWMPIAARGARGTAWQEAIVTLGMYVIGVTLLPAMLLATWGMLRSEARDPAANP